MDEKNVNRREFLKIAGVAGAAVGLGGGLGGLLAACGGEEETTTTAGAETTTTAGATTTTSGATTTVSSEAEMGDEIKIGFVTPKTGAMAPFSSTDTYLLARYSEFAGDGVVLGDKKKHPLSLQVADSQSDPNRAAQVAGDLITNSGVTIMLVASTPDTVNPVANQCEALSTPCFSTDTPYQPFMGAAPAAGWQWTWHAFFGVEDFAGNYGPVWNALPSNKKIGVMWPNDADGNGFAQFMPPVIEAAGLTIVDGGRWQPGTEDFTQQISLFKKEGCEHGTGVFVTPDFTNFWKQCHQQGWVPLTMSVDKGLLYPQAIEAVGAPIGYNLVSTLFWGPTWPYTSYLYGETNQVFADKFTESSGEQWSSALLHAIIFEMGTWALQNAEDPTSKESIKAIAPSMKFEGTAGLIDFSAPLIPQPPAPGPGHVLDRVYKTPTMAGQWVQGTHGHPFDYVSVSNVAASNIPVDAEVLPIPDTTVG
jgi:branched-chain amino acid transport system substrate-binding protein